MRSSSMALSIHSRLNETQAAGAALRHCPSCGHTLDTRAAWVGLPAGVKFDPTDQELIEHLEAKVRCSELRSHPLIDEFISTIDGEDGICYTHPEKLPGASKDGLSKHFFHRPSKAYTTGTRKRRKIQNEHDGGGGETRWHKTGKTRPVTVNGQQKGCKKILVLYTNFGKHRKPEKTNWVMHQYHLGVLEEEREGELVVSKVFYQTQPRQCGGVGGGAIAGLAPSAMAAGLRGVGDELSCVAVGLSGYPAGGGDSFSFSPFRKSFDEMQVGMRHACENHVASSSAFHVSRRSEPVSGVAAPAVHLHQASIVLEEPYHRLILHSESLQRQEHGEVLEQEQRQRLMGRAASGLEEVIMGCSSSSGHGDVCFVATSN